MGYVPIFCHCNTIPIHSTEQNVIINNVHNDYKFRSICINNFKNLITSRNTINKLTLNEPEN